MQKIDVALLEDISIRPSLLDKSSSTSRPASLILVSGMTPALSHILQEVRRALSSNLTQEREINTASELEKIVSEVAAKLGFELSAYERDEILSQLESEQKPFGLLQSLVDNPEVSDIIVSDYAKVSVQQGRKNYSTGIVFPDQSTYEAFVERLLQRAGATYSTKKPIADGMIGSCARIHAVHKSLCDSGPYLTIRLNRFSSVTVDDLVSSGMAPRQVFDYLRAIIATGNTLLVVGEVGTGKTTLVRALAASIPVEESILVIEDTPEIRLEHPQVRYLTTREANIDGAGRIAPSECIRAGMRMAMNRIIFGEMRDAEAAEAFIDVCASGHPGLSTIHARSASEAVSRLELFLGRAQRGVQRQVVTEQIATAVQVIVFVNICSLTGKRRIMQIREVGPVAEGILRHREIFVYQAKHDVPTWKVVNKVSAYRDQIEAINDSVCLSKYPASIEINYTSQMIGATNSYSSKIS